MKIKKTELVEWLVDIDNWFSWSLLFIVPGIIVLVLLLPGLIFFLAVLAILSVIDLITRLLVDKEESEEPKKEEKSVRSPRLVRGVLIDTEEYMSTPNLKKCTPVVMIRKDKLDKYTIPGDIEIVTKKSISGSRLITFLECQDELYSILKVPGKFWYSKRLGVILGLGNKEIDQFIEKIKTK